jgi:hypothetical protein
MKWNSFVSLGTKGYLQQSSIQRNSNGLLLFISSHFSASEFVQIHQSVWNDLKPQKLVGGVVDGINNRQGWAIQSLNQCEIAYFPSSTILRQKQVGRWPSSLKKSTGVSRPFESISQSPFATDFEKPADWKFDPQSFITISDQECFDVYQTLGRLYPDASKVKHFNTDWFSGKPHSFYKQPRLYFVL